MSDIFNLFQSTHLSRGATIHILPLVQLSSISIHTPLTRCDQFSLATFLPMLYFNPHTSHEVRLLLKFEILDKILFQSTHLSRGATDFFYWSSSFHFYFNPHTSHEVRRSELVVLVQAIHLFQSTHLSRGATIFSQQ